MPATSSTFSSTLLQTLGEERQVFSPQDKTGMAHFTYRSPDGKWVLIPKMQSTGGWTPCHLVPFRGGVAKFVGPQKESCNSAAWSPDGKWMYFDSDAGGHGVHVWRQAFPDGEPEQITVGPTEQQGIAIAADGRSFVSAVGNNQRSVWVHDQQGDRQISSEGCAYARNCRPTAASCFTW